MESHAEPQAASAVGSSSAVNLVPAAEVASVAGSNVGESSVEGMLSGVGPNAESAKQVAREKGWTDPVPFEYAELANSKDHRDWAGVAVRYEWKDEYGDVGPAVPELEEQLFRGDLITRPGAKLDELNSYEVNIESPNEIKAVTEWVNFGLHPVMLENIRLCGYEQPTAVQSYAIPAVLNNLDLIAVAQTGSGKTGAFLIPILSKLMGKARKLAAPRPNTTEKFNPREDAVRAEPLVLIVCPTRELATQIFDESRRLCYRSMLRPCVAYGGAPTRLQREELQKGCDILIATPGRLIDFMEQTHVLSLRRVRFTVIDEADEMLDSDWEDEFKKIMSGGDMNEDDDHRYMMFSATFNKEFRKLAKQYLGEDHVRLRVGRAGSSHHNVVQDIVWVDRDKKMRAIYDLLISMPPVRTLIFVNSKEQADFVDDYLYNSGMPTTSIHSGRTQREREDAMRAFRSAKCPIMVATGVSARGLDVINVLHVVNYDLPSSIHGGITEYIHRIGRTARIGNEGIATSFYNERDEDLAEDIVKILVECNQPVPEFLESYCPEGDVLEFDDDSDKNFFDNPSNPGSDAGFDARSDADAESGVAEESDKVVASNTEEARLEEARRSGVYASGWATKGPAPKDEDSFWQ
ncbi:DEAD/DEAH box RNA helicase [Penicillium robsamsonii]|uniref:DEAD/DEAH box RNA helicase n=1 Tax=Penicillium robsamsonii TaxID=1792511 RepID=UPI002547CAC4|nr:DEAD/DEAH box RNA helicase [Penicillium robsamsonii]KAJ5816331.1 DEAD/DEAH box RNA helicase [Penicillium robsamsonii]